jgi:endonuclease/exonuclease/phosphatase family metal-dependent hydrolase
MIVTVATYNVSQIPAPWGIGKRNLRLKRLIEDIKILSQFVDIICLQEVFRRKARKKLKELNEIFPYIYSDNSSGKNLVGSNSGLFVLSKFPIGRSLLKRYSQCRGVENFAKKSLLCLELDLSERVNLGQSRITWDVKDVPPENDPTKLFLFVTNLQSGNESEPFITKVFNRTKLSGNQIKYLQMIEMTQYIKLFCNKNKYPHILCGDLNINSDNTRDYNILVSTLHYDQLRDLHDVSLSSYSSTLFDDEHKRTDYIFSDHLGSSEVSDHFGGKDYISNHRAVIGKIRIS